MFVGVLTNEFLGAFYIASKELKPSEKVESFKKSWENILFYARSQFSGSENDRNLVTDQVSWRCIWAGRFYQNLQ